MSIQDTLRLYINTFSRRFCQLAVHNIWWSYNLH